MKSFIRILTIIIVLTLIPAGSATAQNAVATVSVGSADTSYDMTDSSSSDALLQLRTVLGAQAHQHGGGKVLVIPTTQIQPQDMVNLMEDMTVMCSIFEKKLAQSNLKPTLPFYGMTLPGRISIGRDSLESMYIQGYGALFMTTVDFPLSPPPQKEEKEEIDEDADLIWEQMKQEIFSPEAAVERAPDRQEEKYDARKVENLKSVLIESLVHAANIRGLKPNESVILTVTGKAGRSSGVVIQADSRTNSYIISDKNNKSVRIYTGGLPDELANSSRTVLIIRAKKSYIDALAQKKIDFEEFREKVQILSYPCLGENLIRGSFPSFWRGETTGSSLPSSTPDGLYGGSGRRGRSRSSGIDEVGQSSTNRRRR